MTNVLPASILGAIGMSLAYIPSTMAAMSGAKPKEMGLASGLVNTSYQIDSTLGLAIIKVIAAAKTEAVTAINSTPNEALVEGFQSAFIAAAVLSGLATLMTIFYIKTTK